MEYFPGVMSFTLDGVAHTLLSAFCKDIRTWRVARMISRDQTRNKYVDEEQRNSFIYSLDGSVDPEMDQLIFKNFTRCLELYLIKYEAKNGYFNDEGYHFLKYPTGTYYKYHTDAGLADRVISGVMYLNDDYEGGELEFKFFGKKIKPKAGEVLLFPSNFIYRHQACEVTNGTKLCVTTFFNQPK